jgi:hypothetical protein
LEAAQKVTKKAERFSDILSAFRISSSVSGSRRSAARGLGILFYPNSLLVAR